MSVLNFVSFDAIRTDFNAAMDHLGYVRASVKCKEWGISASDLCRFMKKGYQCDSFIVEGTRFIRKDSKNPKECKYEQ